MVAVVSPPACSALVPSNREVEYSSRRLSDMPGVIKSEVGCNDNFSATSDLCATVEMRDGTELSFFGVGYRSIGEDAVNVLVARVGNRRPFVARCGALGVVEMATGKPAISEGVSTAAQFHRAGMFGSHLIPGLADVPDAIGRYHDLATALEAWPRCPECWAFEDSLGIRVRYCVFDGRGTDRPPPSDPACAR